MQILVLSGNACNTTGQLSLESSHCSTSMPKCSPFLKANDVIHPQTRQRPPRQSRNHAMMHHRFNDARRPPTQTTSMQAAHMRQTTLSAGARPRSSTNLTKVTTVMSNRGQHRAFLLRPFVRPVSCMSDFFPKSDVSPLHVQSIMFLRDFIPPLFWSGASLLVHCSSSMRLGARRRQMRRHRSACPRAENRPATARPLSPSDICPHVQHVHGQAQSGMSVVETMTGVTSRRWKDVPYYLVWSVYFSSLWHC